jgi:hypothetical protein
LLRRRKISRCAELEHSGDHILFASDFANSRAFSIKSLAAGASVRFFIVTLIANEKFEVQSVVRHWPPPPADQEIDVSLTQIAIQHLGTCVEDIEHNARWPEGMRFIFPV